LKCLLNIVWLKLFVNAFYFFLLKSKKQTQFGSF
jgi:hypothetical protein